MTLRLRTAPAAAPAPLRIDRDNRMIYGVTAMLANAEALGHGIMTDMKTLQMMVALADAKQYQRGQLGKIYGHWGHIGMSENATGKKIFEASNFRIEGDRLIHDLKILDSARLSPVFSRDPAQYIFEIAENNPVEMGESVVILTDFVWTTPDGLEHPATDDWGDPDMDTRPDDALTELPLMRPVEFYHVDMVNEGALTYDGMFSRALDTSGAGVARDLFALADSLRNRYGIPAQDVPTYIHAFANNYLLGKGYKGAVLPTRFSRDNQAFMIALLQNHADAVTAALDQLRAQFGVKLSDLPAKVSAFTDAYMLARAENKQGAYSPMDFKTTVKQDLPQKVSFEDMVGAGEIDRPPADEAPDEEPQAEPADPLDDAIEDAAALNEEADEEPQEDAAPADESAAEIEELRRQNAALTAQLAKATELALLNAENNKRLAARLARLEEDVQTLADEPMTTQLVKSTPSALSRPAAPNHAHGFSKPQHVSQRARAVAAQEQNGFTPPATADPAAMGLYIQQARRKAQG